YKMPLCRRTPKSTTMLPLASSDKRSTFPHRRRKSSVSLLHICIWRVHSRKTIAVGALLVLATFFVVFALLAFNLGWGPFQRPANPFELRNAPMDPGQSGFDSSSDMNQLAL